MNDTHTEQGRQAAIRRFAQKWDIPADSCHLQAALTHSSAARTVRESNERLEFLGDALLSSFVARYLFFHLPPDSGEDVLTRARISIVRKETLARAGRDLNLAEMIAVGIGERKENRNQRESLIANAYEAVIAAIFLEKGMEAVEQFLLATLRLPLEEAVQSPPGYDPKTLLQMRMQSRSNHIPVYETLQVTGTGERSRFEVAVKDFAGNVLGRGIGRTKRLAQQAAAQEALSYLEDTPDDASSGSVTGPLS